MYQIEALDHIALHVRDLSQSLDWYQSILGMKKKYLYEDAIGQGNPIVVASGDASVALFPVDPTSPILPFRGHIAMRLTRSNFEYAQAHLHQQGINVSVVHYKRCDSMYFFDPDGYQIELSTYEME